MIFKFSSRGGMVAVFVVLVILVSRLPHLDAKPQSSKDKNDSGPSRSKLTFDEKLAISSKNRPHIKIEKLVTSEKVAYQFPTLPTIKPITFPIFAYPTWGPVKSMPTFSPPKPVSFQPWIYTWPVPTFAPIKSWPDLPNFRPLEIQPLTISKAAISPSSYSTKLDYNLINSALSLPYAAGSGAGIQNVGNTRTSNSVSFVLITTDCDPSDVRCSDNMTLRKISDSSTKEVSITKGDVEEIAELLKDGDEANGYEDAEVYTSQQDSPSYLSYFNYVAPDITSSRVSVGDMNTLGNLADVASRQITGSNDSLPAPLPVSTASDSKPSGINIPGSVGTLTSQENAVGGNSTPELESNESLTRTTTKATV